jgi:hypothetical protein
MWILGFPALALLSLLWLAGVLCLLSAFGAEAMDLPGAVITVETQLASTSPPECWRTLADP